MCWETCDINTSEDGRQHGMSACCCKNKSATEFLTVTSSRECQHSLSTKLGNFLVNTICFYDCVANNLNERLSYQDNEITFHSF